MERLIFSIIIALLTLGFSSCNQQTYKPEKQNFEYEQGGIVRGNIEKKEIALVFTGDKYADGSNKIISTLKKQNVKASFFFTGTFYDNKDYNRLISTLLEEGHYLGAHSNKHLLYCDWDKRDSLLVTKEEFTKDLYENYSKMEEFGISKEKSKYFLPPFEWYNDSISSWTNEMGLHLVNLTRGTLAPADYTTPEMKNYRGIEVIYNSIINYEKVNKSGLNGFILLTHIGTHPDRNDKLYDKLEDLIKELKNRGYKFKRINDLLEN